MVASAHTPFTRIPERVLSHRVSIGGGPPTPKESAPEINESFMTLPPPIVEYVTLMSPRPAASACFSSNLSCSMIMIGRCGIAKPRAICTSFTSADAATGSPNAATTHSTAAARCKRWRAPSINRRIGALLGQKIDCATSVCGLRLSRA